jgi:hypothetical protein
MWFGYLFSVFKGVFERESLDDRAWEENERRQAVEKIKESGAWDTAYARPQNRMLFCITLMIMIKTKISMKMKRFV